MVQNVRLRVRVLVKAFPQASARHEETVCCAGVTEDGKRFLRLFPIRFRRLPATSRFTRYDLVEMTATKASDPRPESYRVDEASIKVVSGAPKLSEIAKIRLWQPFISPSLDDLHADNKKTNRSLGIIRPDPGSIRFFARPAKEADQADRDIAESLGRVHQQSLLEEPLTPLEKPEFSFGYRYTSGGKPHEHVIHDWEVQAAYREYRRKYQDDAMDRLKEMYGRTLPEQNLHFIMGTMKAHPRTFILIGLLRTKLDPTELAKQRGLL
jgi:hypothetical protein